MSKRKGNKRTRKRSDGVRELRGFNTRLLYAITFAFDGLVGRRTAFSALGLAFVVVFSDAFFNEIDGFFQC